MNSTHTPGPWRIGDAGAVIFGPKSDRPSPVTVAAVGRAGGNPDQARANARLISAAPELLAALQAALCLYDQGQMKLDGDSGSDPLIESARAAIAKATATHAA